MPFLLASHRADVVLAQLDACNPDTRARLLEQMQKAGTLHPFLDVFGFKQVKALHDGLGVGFADLKTEMQSHFTGRDGFGPEVGQEWDTHANSLGHDFAQLPYVGPQLALGLDDATFGFAGEYGQLRDAYTSGEISEADYNFQFAHLAARTAAMAAVSIATAGGVNSAIRGGRTAVSATRALVASTASGATASTSGRLTHDVYNYALDGRPFSSFGDYLETFAYGGVFGFAGGVPEAAEAGGLGELPAGSRGALPAGENAEFAAWAQTERGAALVRAAESAGLSAGVSRRADAGAEDGARDRNDIQPHRRARQPRTTSTTRSPPTVSTSRRSRGLRTKSRRPSKRVTSRRKTTCERGPMRSRTAIRTRCRPSRWPPIWKRSRAVARRSGRCTIASCALRSNHQSGVTRERLRLAVEGDPRDG